MQEIRYALTLLSEGDDFEPIPLEPGRNTVGRSSTNIVAISDQSVSRQHLVIIVNGPDVLVEDLNSAGGTFINENQVVAFSKKALKLGDVLTMGNCRCRLIQVVVETDEASSTNDDDPDGKTIIKGM